MLVIQEFVNCTLGACAVSLLKFYLRELKDLKEAVLTMEAGLLLLLVAVHACVATEVPSVLLQNAAAPGMKMPVIGIGTGAYVYEPRKVPGEIWTEDICEKASKQWLDMGGRRIDASLSYRNQPGVGRAIKDSNVSREEIFIVTKVGSGGLVSGSALGYNDTLIQMQPILDSLQMDYVDLLLIHWPGPPGNSSDPACQGKPATWRNCRQSTWKAMEEIYRSGKAKAIGVSNFEKNHLEDIIVMKSLLPAVNQVEFHPYWHEEDLLAFCNSYNITFNGYSPLGCPDWAPPSHNWTHTLLEEPTVIKIAKSHDRTPAQVILRWEWQKGVLAQPRTVNPKHMMENMNYFDFTLSDDEMKQLSNITPPHNPKVCPDPHKFL